MWQTLIAGVVGTIIGCTIGLILIRCIVQPLQDKWIERLYQEYELSGVRKDGQPEADGVPR